jgi:hypothetical protein
MNKDILLLYKYKVSIHFHYLNSEDEREDEEERNRRILREQRMEDDAGYISDYDSLDQRRMMIQRFIEQNRGNINQMNALNL